VRLLQQCFRMDGNKSVATDERGGDVRLLQQCFWIWIWKREHARLGLQQDRSTTIATDER
jgi:hypothetical protein